MYRLQLVDRKTLVMHWHMHHDGAAHWRSWKRKGKPMPVAICLGGEGVPLIRLLSTAGDVPLEGERLAAMARELDAAWAALEAAAAEERARWGAEAALVRAWQPPRWPIIAGATLALLVLGWLGLALGGWIPAPGPLAAVRDAITALP